MYNPDPKFIPIQLKKLTVPIKKEKKETEKKKTKDRKQKKGTEKTKQKKSPKEERPPVVRVDSDGEDVGDSEVCSDSDDARPLGRSRRQCNTPEPRPKPNPNPNPNPKPKLKPKPEPEPAGQPQSYWAWMYEPDDSASILYQNSLKIRGCFPYAKAPHLSAALAPVQIAAAP